MSESWMGVEGRVACRSSEQCNEREVAHLTNGWRIVASP